MQQIESNKFLYQISNLSHNIFSKMDYQKNFMLIPQNIRNKQPESTKKEIALNKKKFSLSQINVNINCTDNKVLQNIQKIPNW